MILDKIVSAMGWPFAIIYICIGLGAIYFLFISIPKTLRTKSWPQASGKITKSELWEGKRPSSHGGHTSIYSPSIEYTYIANGNTYTSKKIKWVDHNSTNKNTHLLVLEKYPIGMDVFVFYNPKKPSQAILEPGIGFGNIIAALFFLLSLSTMTFVLSTKI